MINIRMIEDIIINVTTYLFSIILEIHIREIHIIFIFN